jgi:thiol-disulfide isomerase/thioredoxin
VILLFREYSFAVVALGLAIIAGVILLAKNPKWNDYLAFGAILTALVVAWVIIHPRQTLLMDNAKSVQNMIGSGTPVLLEFQSPFCITCTQIKPVVDKLEAELNSQVSIGVPIHIIRINIRETVGMELAPEYDLIFTPTFIFFDAQGNEIWRQIGEFDPQKVRDSLK